jgi:hypothetical protein
MQYQSSKLLKVIYMKLNTDFGIIIGVYYLRSITLTQILAELWLFVNFRKFFVEDLLAT